MMSGANASSRRRAAAPRPKVTRYSGRSGIGADGVGWTSPSGVKGRSFVTGVKVTTSTPLARR